MNKIAIKVKKQAEKSILQGHPWIYESSIVKQNREGKAGDLAIVFKQKDNKLLAIGLYDPTSVIRVRVLNVGSPVNIDKAFFTQKFEKAFQKRQPLLQTKTTAYRLIYGENDGLPGLIVDIYNSVAVIKLYAGIWVPYLNTLETILEDHYECPTVLLRLNRLLQQSQLELKDGDLLSGHLDSEEVIFYEHGLRFHANLRKGHKTGYFLDHRHNRRRVRDLAKDKKVLDLFAYAGGFSVNALAGGAEHVTSLDISAQALEVAQKNIKLNFDDSRHEIKIVDAFLGLKKMRTEAEKFGLIICDPPSFAKSEEQIPGALQSYKRLVKAVLPLLEDESLLLMCSCSSRIIKETFYELVIEEIELSKRRYRIVEKTDHDVDHPLGVRELNYLKSIYIEFW